MKPLPGDRYRLDVPFTNDFDEAFDVGDVVRVADREGQPWVTFVSRGKGHDCVFVRYGDMTFEEFEASTTKIEEA